MLFVAVFGGFFGGFLWGAVLAIGLPWLALEGARALRKLPGQRRRKCEAELCKIRRHNAKLEEELGLMPIVEVSAYTLDKLKDKL
jgi:hypothetical protein